MRVISTASDALQQSWRQQLAQPIEQAAYAHALLCKVAATPVTSMSLSGELYASKSGWLLLSVPNALVRGLFQALDEPGAELPLHSDGSLSGHVSVMRPEEIERIGGIDKITERGKRFKYQLGGLRSVKPAGWPGMSKVWFLRIFSPELQQLRVSYGLPPLPVRNGETLPFHLTAARRAAGVLGRNEISKAAAAIDPGRRLSGEGLTEHRQFAGDVPDCPECHSNWTSHCRSLAGNCQCQACGHTYDDQNYGKTARLFTLAELDTPEGHRKLVEQIATPTPAEAAAGNYSKGHLKLHGYDITIETGKGQFRKGVSKDGKAWSQKLHSHYGYICARGGVQKSKADGDHLDCFVGDHPESELIFAIDQIDPKTGKFDECKFMLGFLSEASAREGYLVNYESGWKGLSAITPLTMPQFDWWLQSGDTSKPIAGQLLKKAAAERLLALISG